MSDLIKRQAAIEIIQSMYPGMPRIPWMRKDWQKRYEPYIRVENAIRKLPSAQPELVWCKDCEQWYTEEDEDDEYGYCRNHEFWTSGIWYCADGDRRRE